MWNGTHTKKNYFCNFVLVLDFYMFWFQWVPKFYPKIYYLSVLMMCVCVVMTSLFMCLKAILLKSLMSFSHIYFICKKCVLFPQYHR